MQLRALALAFTLVIATAACRPPEPQEPTSGHFNVPTERLVTVVVIVVLSLGLYTAVDWMRDTTRDVGDGR